MIVVNARQARRQRCARPSDKLYYRHSGYPGGIRSESLEHLLGRDPERVVALAVKGMLPKSRLGRQMMQEAAGLRRPDPSARGAAARSRTTLPSSAPRS